MDACLRGERWRFVAGLLAAASTACVALIAARIVRTGEPDLAFLVWNLALAWIPLMLAVVVWGGYRHGTPASLLLVPGVLWLLFLPNAPYILTDFIHLQGASGVPVWYDAATIGASATTGMLLGFASLYLMQAVAASAVGERLVWWFVLVVLGLSSIGIYLGRFQRLNSWDAVRRPGHIGDMALARARDPFANPTLLAVTVGFTAALTATYLALYTFALPRLRQFRGDEEGAQRGRAARG
jgi:uncharacterized membrane protein